MHEHIIHGHSLLYCHACDFKANNKNEMIQHEHYQDLLEDISNCDICGITLVDIWERCLECTNENKLPKQNLIFLQCDLCAFSTVNENEFISHQNVEAERLVKLIQNNNFYKKKNYDKDSLAISDTSNLVNHKNGINTYDESEKLDFRDVTLACDDKQMVTHDSVNLPASSCQSDFYKENKFVP